MNHAKVTGPCRRMVSRMNWVKAGLPACIELF